MSDYSSYHTLSDEELLQELLSGYKRHCGALRAVFPEPRAISSLKMLITVMDERDVPVPEIDKSLDEVLNLSDVHLKYHYMIAREEFKTKRDVDALLKANIFRWELKRRMPTAAQEEWLTPTKEEIKQVKAEGGGKSTVGSTIGMIFKIASISAMLAGAVRACG